MNITRRELLQRSGQAAAVCAAGKLLVTEAFAQSPSNQYSKAFAKLDEFIEQYLPSMNAPGLTLAIADRDGVQRVSTYGFSDVAAHQRVEPNQLFEIGSISKSFLALVLLQLRDEGKLDLHKPVADYLPWLKIDSQFAPITVHHLLTHTSGLPSGPLFLSDPAAKHRAAYAPGEHFHYNNMAFVAMGHLAETLGGVPFRHAFRRRIFEPLGMTETEPVITIEARDRMAKNWWPFFTDRPYPRFGKLSEAPPLIMTDASGCIASTPRDMGLYVQMIANGGRGPKGRIVSEESFALFSKPHIKAEEFGPTASYGYGIAVDTLDGHHIVRHTGGMVSFASAMHIDLDSGVGAFASINAMQGYRPNPVVQHAIQLMRAAHEGKPLPSAPEVKAPTLVENASDFAGTYTEVDRKVSARDPEIKILADGKSLMLVSGARRVPLQVNGTDRFLADDPDFNRYAFVFGRANAADPKSPVVEVGWGEHWYANDKYAGAKTFAHPKEWAMYVGHYRSENVWNGSLRIVQRKGQVMIDGVVPLELKQDGMYYLRDEESNTEWVSFHDVVNGKAMRIKLSGDDFWRVDAE